MNKWLGVLFGLGICFFFCASCKENIEVMSFPIDKNASVYYAYRDTVGLCDECFVFDKQDDGVVTISSMRQLSYYIENKKKKIRYKYFKRDSMNPSSEDYLERLKSCLAKARESYPIDSLRKIYCITVQLPDAANSLSNRIRFKPIEQMEDFGVNAARANVLLRSSGFYEMFNSVLKGYNLVVDTIQVKDSYGEVEFMGVEGKVFVKYYPLKEKTKVPNWVLLSPLTVLLKSSN